MKSNKRGVSVKLLFFKVDAAPFAGQDVRLFVSGKKKEKC